MAQTPSINDKTYDLWYKIAANLYNHAIINGKTGLTPPDYGRDTRVNIMSKITYYTAALAS